MAANEPFDSGDELVDNTVNQLTSGHPSSGKDFFTQVTKSLAEKQQWWGTDLKVGS